MRKPFVVKYLKSRYLLNDYNDVFSKMARTLYKNIEQHLMAIKQNTKLYEVPNNSLEKSTLVDIIR